MTLDELRSLIDAGQFHHATYRNQGTLWEGLWIYGRSDTGFQGYAPAGAFYKGNADLPAAEDMVRGSGISVGSYGNG